MAPPRRLKVPEKKRLASPARLNTGRDHVKRHVVVSNAHVLGLVVLGSCCRPTAVAVSLCRSACISPLRSRTGRLVVAAAEQDDVFGNNLCDVYLSPLPVIVAARLQPAFDVYLLPFGEVIGQVFLAPRC